MLLNNNTNGNYTMRQLKLPLEIEKLIDTKNEFLNSTAQWGDGIHSRTVDIYSFI